MEVRRPAVAGTFYEADAARLRAQVDRCFAEAGAAAAREPLLGAVVPHAGLMYSGHVAATLYAAADLPRRLVLLGPNHTGRGETVAVDREGAWQTPLGDAAIDAALAAAILAEAPFARADRAAHAREHSLEVQLPFLLSAGFPFTFVPVCAATPTFERTAELGRAIARAIAKAGEPVAILASSDFNHYENEQTTQRKDAAAIERILALDPAGLWNVVRGGEISMCGIIPTTAMLIAARELGATRARLLRHATSGDVNGDYDAVVGYGALLIS